MVIDSERMISTNIKLPVISLSVVKLEENQKMFVKLILAKLIFDIIRSYCSNLFQSIVNKSHKILFLAFLCVELHVLL